MADLRQDKGRAWLVLVAAFLGVGIITDGIGVSYNQKWTLSHYNRYILSRRIKHKILPQRTVFAMVKFLLSFQYAFGLIYTELLLVYNESNEQTSWIGSLQQACGLIFGN